MLTKRNATASLKHFYEALQQKT